MLIPLDPNSIVNHTPMTGYRPCAAMVIVNNDGMTLFARRKGNLAKPWQYPQGGIEPNESPQVACMRELQEETGLEQTNIMLVAHATHWIEYQLPSGSSVIEGNPYLGQIQAWFLLRIQGTPPDLDILLSRALHNELVELRWLEPARALEEVVPFKQDTYRRALGYFANNHMNEFPTWKDVA